MTLFRSSSTDGLDNNTVVSSSSSSKLKDAVDPSVSVRAFLNGGDGGTKRNKEKPCNSIHDTTAMDSLCDASSLASSSSFYNRQKQLHERRKRLEKTIVKSIKEQEAKIDAYDKLIHYKESIVDLRLRSGSEKGVIVEMKQLLKTESLREEAAEAIQALEKLRKLVSSFDDAAVDDEEADEMLKEIETNYHSHVKDISAVRPSQGTASLHTPEVLLHEARQRFQAAA